MFAVTLYSVLAGLFVILGVWVLAARPRATENRALGILLMLLAGSTVAFYRLRNASSSSATLAFAEFITWYELPLALLIAILVDELFLPKPRTRLRWGVLGTLGLATVAGLVVHGTDPAAFHEIVPAGSEVPTGRNGVTPRWGGIVKGLLVAGFEALAVVLAARAAVDEAKSPIQRRQAAVFGISFAFLVGHAGTSTALNKVSARTAQLSHAWVGLDAAVHAIGLVAVFWAARRLLSPFEARARWAAGIALAAPILFGAWDAGFYGWFGTVPDPLPTGNTRPVWLGAFGLGLGVAVIRYGLAGVSRVPNRRLVAVTAGTLALGVIGAGFGVGLLGLGVTAEGLAVALVSLAVPAIVPFTPLRAVPRRLLDHVLLDPSKPAVVRERVRVYTSALEAAQADNGEPPDEDQPVLASLRRELGFTRRDHRLLTSMLNEDEDDEEPDILLGRYAVEDVLHETSTATTLRARDGYLGRQVVLKHVHEVPGDRLVAEARALSRVQHPHVVEVHDARPYEQGAVLVLEHLAGGSLADRLEQGPLEPDEAWRLFEQVLDALETVHGDGLVHADVKPSNVLLTETGEAKLADFGTARSIRPADETRAVPSAEVTPNAAAPEQLLHGEATEATDVYQAGALLYRMLTGQAPIDVEGLTLQQASAEIAKGAPGVDDERVPEAWQGVIERCLAKDPNDRFSSIAELRRVLRDHAPVETDVWGPGEDGYEAFGELKRP